MKTLIHRSTMMQSVYVLCLLVFARSPWLYAAAGETKSVWQVGRPIVTYWCGPALTDAAAQQMAREPGRRRRRLEKVETR